MDWLPEYDSEIGLYGQSEVPVFWEYRRKVVDRFSARALELLVTFVSELIGHIIRAQGCGVAVGVWNLCCWFWPRRIMRLSAFGLVWVVAHASGSRLLGLALVLWDHSLLPARIRRTAIRRF